MTSILNPAVPAGATYLDGRCHRAAASMMSTTALIRLSPVSLRKNGREPQ